MLSKVSFALGRNVSSQYIASQKDGQTDDTFTVAYARNRSGNKKA